MELEKMNGLVVEFILSKLGPKNAGIFACVSSLCKSYASDDGLWRVFCRDDLDLLQPRDPDGNPCPSFKVAYRMWRESFKSYPFGLVKRCKKSWSDIKNWALDNFPEVLPTLQTGASELEIRDLEEKLGVELPVPTRVLYRFCNGQSTKPTEMFTNIHYSLGIIGGYSFYDHVVNVHWLPLDLVIAETNRCRIMFDGCSDFIVSKCIVVACSSDVEKLFLLNCTNGLLYVGTKNFMVDGEMLPCVPKELIRLDFVGDLPQQDGLLLWFEEHVRSCQSGKIRVRANGKNRGINLFPELPPLCSTAITHGVQVRASAMYIPERSDEEERLFSYSIRMRLLPEGCRLDGIHFTSCQLSSRHWIIRCDENVVNILHGEAVIGKYPLLSTDKGEFVYESCALIASTTGSVEGSFTFVPGRLTNPEGRQFEVEVGRFSLTVPDYIF